MRTHRSCRLLWLGAILISFPAAAPPLSAAPILPFPTADDIVVGAFIQPFGGVLVVSESGGIGRTEPFFVDLPDGALPGNFATSILAQLEAFDDLGNPAPFQLVGVEVDDLGGTFTPPYGSFDFAGRSSLTFTDPVDLDVVTISSADPTFAFSFVSDPALDYSYTLFVTGLSVNSIVLFTEIDPPSVPEPASLVLLISGLAGVTGCRARSRRKESVP